MRGELMKYNIFYNADFIASDYAFDTTRKSGELAASLRDGGEAKVVDPGLFGHIVGEMWTAIQSRSIPILARMGIEFPDTTRWSGTTVFDRCLHFTTVQTSLHPADRPVVPARFYPGLSTDR
jgi:hypothetical protein